MGKIQNVAVTTLEKFRSGVRKRRNLAPRSLPENDVRFIDPMYNELFRVPDGGVVQMTYPDGHQRSEVVEYLDDYHMKIGSSVRHICEFAERMARSHAIVEPEPLTQQNCRAWIWNTIIISPCRRTAAHGSMHSIRATAACWSVGKLMRLN